MKEQECHFRGLEALTANLKVLGKITTQYLNNDFSIREIWYKL